LGEAWEGGKKGAWDLDFGYVRFELLFNKALVCRNSWVCFGLVS
jgi:hypothetical protein